MSNYLNQIESDLYKLNSITNGSGEVVEMVAELKEKYRRAEVFDDSLEAFEELRDFYEKVKKTTERSQIRAMIYKEAYSNVLREMKLIYEESGEYDA